MLLVAVKGLDEPIHFNVALTVDLSQHFGLLFLDCFAVVIDIALWLFPHLFWVRSVLQRQFLTIIIPPLDLLNTSRAD